MRDTPASTRMLTFRSGGWVLLLAGVVTLGIMLWAIAGAVRRQGTPLLGDGVNVETYGFDFTNCLVPRGDIVAGGMRKDALKPLVYPQTMRGRDVARFNAEKRGKYLVPTDRVIGVSIGGESRAYPLLILNCHEIVNDSLGGVPIAVTYNPLCDSVATFEREVHGETLLFGVSGLLHNSNLLMYDQRPGGVGESLWSQLRCRAIAGPAAATGHTLRLLDASLVAWEDWLDRHPDTTVLDPDPGMTKRYGQTSYDAYFRTDALKFPVAARIPPDGPPGKSHVVVVKTGDDLGVWRLDDIGRHADDAGVWNTTLGQTPLRFEYRAEPETAAVSAGEAEIGVMYSFWFAWYAMYGDTGMRDEG